MCLAFIAVLMFANLRGLKESGTVFAVPTYVYIVAVGALIVYGFVPVFGGDLDPLAPVAERYDDFTDGAYSTGALVGRHGVPAHARLLVRCRRPHRHRSHLQRRAGVQEARVEERGHAPSRRWP